MIDRFLPAFFHRQRQKRHRIPPYPPNISKSEVRVVSDFSHTAALPTQRTSTTIPAAIASPYFSAYPAFRSARTDIPAPAILFHAESRQNDSGESMTPTIGPTGVKADIRLKIIIFRSFLSSYR